MTGITDGNSGDGRPPKGVVTIAGYGVVVVNTFAPDIRIPVSPTILKKDTNHKTLE